MYKLPKEIKEILTLSIIITILISILLIFIDPMLIIFFLMGFISSIINLFRNNYQITSMLYNVVQKKKFSIILTNALGLSLYFIVLLIGFFIGIVEGFIVAIGIFVIKMVIVLSSILEKDGDRG